jgi:radical SAM superfamily enzyme YgiQ (UPF0313 family)
MRVLLCQSYLGPQTKEPIIFPLGEAYLASMIEKEHELRCFDPNVSSDPANELGSILEDFRPDVVGVSFRNVDGIFSFNKRSYYPQFVSLVRTIREKAQSCKLVVGGAAYSIFSKEIMEKNREIDFGIVSEGEYAFATLLKNLDNPERVKNLVFRKGEKLFFTGKDEFLDFNDLPAPSREHFDLKAYKNKPASMGVQSKRGCGFECIYCLHGFLMGRTYRLRSPRKVVDEIQELVQEHGVNSFYFVDPVFNFPLDHGREICMEIIKRKLDIQWEAAFRPDFINAPFMQMAIKAGCRLFDFSPDGASDSAMRTLGKNLKVEHVEKTIELARKTERACVAYEFVYDLPANNPEHNLGLIRLIPKIKLLCGTKLRYLLLSKMRIFPNTPLYEVALRQGKITKDVDLMFPVHYESKTHSTANFLPYLVQHTSNLSAKFVECCKSLRNKI